MASDVDRVDDADDFSMKDNDQDDIVEIIPARRAVSSGEPSLDGSIDEERAALSDSDITHAARSNVLATQVKGPSSDALEGACRLEHEARDLGYEWEDVLGSGDLFKKTLKAGVGSHKVVDGQWITVKIVDTLRGCDSHEKLRFITGFGMVIDAWELVVKLMTEGEICAVRTSARFAYGDEGQLPDIGPGQQMEYTLEVLEIGESPKYMEMPEEELVDFVIMLKARGNYYFGCKEYEKAVFVYKRALNLVDTPDESENLRKLFSALNSNLSVCYSKLEDWKNVKESADIAIKLDSLNSKAYFHRATAYATAGDVELALEDLRKAQLIEPNDKSIAREIDRVTGLCAQARCREKAVYRRMVSGLISEDYPDAQQSLLQLAVSFLRSPKHIVIVSFFVLMLSLFVYYLRFLW